MKQFLLIYLIFFSYSRLFGTGQAGDRIIIGKDTLELLATPLDKILSERNISAADIWSTKNFDWSTACWNGYIAMWKLENNRLYLEEIGPCNYYDYPKGDYPKADLQKLFPDLYSDGHIFASWLNEELLIAKGKMLWYMHDAFDRIYEKELGLTFKNGILEKSNEYDNSKTKESPYLKNERLLNNYIYSSIRWKEISSEIDEIPKRVICTIVSADDRGKIDSVRIMRGASEKLNDEAVRVIKSIPQWEVLYKRGKRWTRQYTLPVIFDLKTMKKYNN
jgi:hypothetical protein